MPKAAKPGYYAVRIGRAPGIYHSWADCEAQVKGFVGATYKKLSTEAEAIQFMSAKPGTARPSASPVTSPSRAVASTVIHQPKAPLETADKDEKDCDIVYCDGACKGNGTIGSVAGVGVWWGHGDPRNIAERCPGDQTNNRAELIAIVRILETTPRLKRKLLIKTDSHYSIQCVTSWISKWMSNGFLAADGKQVKNRELIKYLAELLHIRRKTSQTVEFKHVRGHVGIEGNEAADQLANIGTTKPTLPERDWGKLEKEVLKSLEVAHNGLKEYSNASVSNTVLPAQEPRWQRWGDEKGAIPVVARETFPPRLDIAAGSTTRRDDGVSAAHSRSDIPFRGPSGPGGILAPGPQFAPINDPTPVMSQEELEIYASCLLGDDELSAFGKDGAFDSDF